MVDFIEEKFKPRDWVKVRAGTDGEQSFLTWKGSIYAVVPGEHKKLLFKIVGMSVARFILNSDDSWDFISRELGLYLDPQSGEKLDRWQNPWTDEVVPVAHIANSLVQGYFDSERCLPALVAGEFTTFVLDLFSHYPNPLGEDAKFAPYSPQPIYQATELFKLTVPTAELKNSETVSISQVMLAWDRIGPWLPWMKMSDRPGYLIYSAWGGKLSSFTDLPQLLQDEINTHVPLYQNAPQRALDQDNITSWKYFKQHFDAYLRGERFPIAESE